jgi:ketosteroid isomerase-like protein
VRRAFEALNQRDADALLDDSDPDLILDWSRSVGPEPGTFYGRDQVLQFLRSWWDTFDVTSIGIEELIDAGGQVITLFHATNRGRGSGVEVAGQPGVALVWAVHGGKIASVTLYQRRSEALEAVGLSE